MPPHPAPPFASLQGGPYVELAAHAFDNGVGELGRGRMAAQIARSRSPRAPLPARPRRSPARRWPPACRRCTRAPRRPPGSWPSGWRRSCPGAAGPCRAGASAMTTDGLSSPVEGEQHRFGAGDRAEELHHQIRKAVAVAVERGDDQRRRLRSRAAARTSRRSAAARTATSGWRRGGGVHLFLKHSLVDRADRVLRAAEDLRAHLARRGRTRTRRPTGRRRAKSFRSGRRLRRRLRPRAIPWRRRRRRRPCARPRSARECRRPGARRGSSRPVRTITLPSIGLAQDRVGRTDVASCLRRDRRGFEARADASSSRRPPRARARSASRAAIPSERS